MDKTFPQVPFDVSMRPSEAYDRSLAARDRDWLFLKKLYLENFLDLEAGRGGRYAIPKIIHQIWLGGELPERFKGFQQSFRRLHPGWEYRLWGDTQAQQLEMSNRELFDRSPNYGSKSDLMRYEILFNYGGLYADVDFECLKPFDLLHRSLDFYTGVAYERHALLFNGLIGAAPRHPVIGRCLESAGAEGGKAGAPEADRIMDSTGPEYFTRCFRQTAPGLEGRIAALPATYFYPFPGSQRFCRDRQKIRAFIQPESFCLHYWACSWVPREKKGLAAGLVGGMYRLYKAVRGKKENQKR